MAIIAIIVTIVIKVTIVIILIRLVDVRLVKIHLMNRNNRIIYLLNIHREISDKISTISLVGSTIALFKSHLSKL